jgi:MoxR-like ATPase
VNDPTLAATVSPDAARAALTAVRAEVAKAVVGQDAAVTGLVIALLARGHVLLEGVPGVAKTLLVRSLSAALRLETTRVQFTPDLMPGDVTGSLVYDARTAEFSFREGPVFTNLLLADEVNRTPPKTQASLLEAMEERQVSVDGKPRPLPEPFVVCATQNPVEYEGTRCRRRSWTGSCSSSSCRCRRARTRSRCCAGTPSGSTRATWRAPGSARSPVRSTSPRAPPPSAG